MNVFLSAHSDDVAFSIGGLLLCRDLRPAQLVTVFQRGTHVPMAVADASAAVATALRIHEDLVYCSRLGLDHRGLSLPDATGRGYDLDALFTREAAEEDPRSGELIEGILAALNRCPAGTRVWAPLAIGNHIDHLILRRAAIDWRAAVDGELVLYEDLPYAGWESLEAVDRWVAATVADLTPELVDITERLAEKLDLARTSYQSQVTQQDLGLIARHARRMVPGRAVERFWRFPNGARQR